VGSFPYDRIIAEVVTNLCPCVVEGLADGFHGSWTESGTVNEPSCLHGNTLPVAGIFPMLRLKWSSFSLAIRTFPAFWAPVTDH
jgi:hypothetical protein